MSLEARLSRYESLGLGLLILGTSLAVYSNQVLYNTPFVALGLSSVILGATLLWIPNNPVPTHQIRAMVEGACINIEALLEEFDALEMAVYLPPREGRVYAFAPLGVPADDFDISQVGKALFRVLTEVSGKFGLMLFPPGSEIVRLSLIPEELGVEEALNYVLVDFLEAVKSVKAVEDGDEIVVEMMSPRMKTEFPRFQSVLGSIPSSIAACVIVSATGKPVFIQSEDVEADRIRTVFRLESLG